MLHWLRRALGALAGLSLFAMMMLTVVDVVGRKFIGESLVGSLELTELAMLLLIFCALPLASLAGEHVVLDMLDTLLPDRIRRWQHVISNLISAALMGAVGWFLFERAARTASMGDETAQLAIPIAPFHDAAAVLVLVTAAMHLVLALRRRPSA
ncbi:MAG: TRAP transporter small permease [Lautropia sp.]